MVMMDHVRHDLFPILKFIINASKLERVCSSRPGVFQIIKNSFLFLFRIQIFAHYNFLHLFHQVGYKENDV